MNYLGSKRRIAKHILPIILADRGESQYYVEPFCGGCNSIEGVTGLRIANDIEPFLIACMEAISLGWKPPKTCSEGLYNRVKKYPSRYKDRRVGQIAYSMSFGGMYFQGYAKGTRSNGLPIDFAMVAYRHLCKQGPKLKGIEFHNVRYDELLIPDNSIIYCDPPYADTAGYISGDFDHKAFWNWVRLQSANHQVFVSELKAPEDFETLWEMKIGSSMGKGRIEKLFKYKG